jgi:hypothetical protein
MTGCARQTGSRLVCVSCAWPDDRKMESRSAERAHYQRICGGRCPLIATFASRGSWVRVPSAPLVVCRNHNARPRHPWLQMGVEREDEPHHRAGWQRQWARASSSPAAQGRLQAPMPQPPEPALEGTRCSGDRGAIGGVHDASRSGIYLGVPVGDGSRSRRGDLWWVVSSRPGSRGRSLAGTWRAGSRSAC